MITALAALSLSVPAEAVLTDTAVHAEPGLTPLPPAGGSLTDPVFGTPILRITDAGDGSDCRNEYSYWPTFNAATTRLKALCVIGGTNRTKFWTFDPVNFQRGPALPLMPMTIQSTDPIWSGSNPDIVYGHSMTHLLLSYNLATQASTPLKDFSSVVPSGGQLEQMSMSENDDVFAFHLTNSAGAPVGYVVWKRSSNTFLLQRTEAGVDEVQIDKTGRYLEVGYTNGNNRIWDLQPAVPTFTDLTWGADGFFHHDSGRGTLLTYTGSTNGFGYRPLSSPHGVTPLLVANTGNRTAHFSMRATNEGWGLVSQYRDDGGAAVSPFDNEIFQAATDGSGQVRRIAHHRSVYNDYYDQPVANISVDGQFVAFTSNWGNPNGRRDVFVAKITAAPNSSPPPSTYFVAPTGNDAFPGTEAQPWKTIQKAFDSATAGSTVSIKAGTYPQALALHVSGSPTAGFITFRNLGSDSVIIDGAGITAPRLIDIVNQRYVRIQGLTIRNFVHDAGIALSISGGSDHIEIQGNTFTNIKIAAGTTRQVIANNTMVWNVPLRITGDNPVRPNDHIVVDGNTFSNCEEGWGETLTVTGNSTNWAITRNHLVNCRKFIDASGFYGDSSDPATDQARNGLIAQNTVSDTLEDGIGIYIDGAKDVVVERNTLMRNPWGVVVSCERSGKTASGIIVRSNLIYDNTEGGIAVGGWISSYGRVVDSQVFGNTLVGNKVGLNLNLASRIAFENNVVAQSEAAVLAIAGNDSSSSFDYNLYDSATAFGATWNGVFYPTFSAYRQASLQDVQSLVVDPLFVNRGAKNYHLTAASPAINRGDPHVRSGFGSLDIDGQARLMNARIDIGADETSDTGLPVSACDLNSDHLTDVADVQLAVNQAVGITGCTTDLNADGRCDVVDVQRVVIAVLTGVCATP